MVVKTTIPAAAKTGRVVGAPSATAPMLLDLKRWKVPQCLWLPGQAGNYASIPDVNLLDADTAHLHQSISEWRDSSGTSSVSHITTDALFGGGCGEAVASGAQDYSYARSGYFPATVGTTYSASAVIKPSVTDRFVRISIYFYDSAKATIETNHGMFTSSTADVWTTADVTAVAPPNTTYVLVFISVHHVDGVTALGTGETWRWDRVVLREGTDPTFVPSHRIVEDLDVRARLAMKDWTPTVETTISDKWSQGNQRGYLFSVTTAGRLRLYWSTDGVDSSSAQSTVSVDAEDQWVRATLDVDNGAATPVWEVTFYTSPDGVTWTQLGTVVSGTATTSVFPSNRQLAWGSRTEDNKWHAEGTFFNSEVRDGIDGPIVASADFTDSNEVTGDSWTTPEGHAASIIRSGDATAELVDRNCWGFTGGSSEWLEIPRNPLIDIGSSDFSIFGSTLARFTSGVHGLVATRQGGGVPGWAVEGNGSAMRLSMSDGPQHIAIGNSNILSDGTWHMAGIGRDTLLRAFVDDTENPNADNLGGLVSPYDLRFGRSVNGAWSGLSRWLAGFTRVLTDQERAQLAAWDGSVEQEPSWLRGDPDLVLYLNADDPLTAVNYANGDVVDLKGVTHPKNYTKVPLRT